MIADLKKWFDNHEFANTDEMQGAFDALKQVRALSAQARASEAEDAALQPETATVPVGELVALRRNAARYLWAKEHLFDYLPPMYNGNPKGRHDVLWYTEEHDLDKAIDAARATQGDAGSRGENGE